MTRDACSPPFAFSNLFNPSRTLANASRRLSVVCQGRQRMRTLAEIHRPDRKHYQAGQDAAVVPPAKPRAERAARNHGALLAHLLPMRF